MTEMRGPNRMAAVLTAKIAEIETQRKFADTRQERSDLRRMLHRHRELLRWCRTRTGYRSEIVAANVCDVADRGAEK